MLSLAQLVPIMFNLFLFSITVITFHGIPPPAEGEDIGAISMAFLDRLTGVKLSKDTIRSAHRMGSKILVEFLFARVRLRKFFT